MDQELSKSQRASKSHQWFKSYSHFNEGVDLAYWLSCTRKGLRLQPAQQACFSFKKSILKIFFWRFLTILLNFLGNLKYC